MGNKLVLIEFGVYQGICQDGHMCSKVICSGCGKFTWSGCGEHIDFALAGLNKDQICSCDGDLSGWLPK